MFIFLFSGTSGLRDRVPNKENKLEEEDEEEEDKEKLNFHISDDEDMIENSQELPPDIQEIFDKPVPTKPDNIPSQRETVETRLTDDSDDDGPPLEEKICKYADDIHPETALVEATQSEKPENPPRELISNISGISEYSSRKRKRKHKEEKVPERKRPTDVFSRPIRPPTLLEKLLLDEIKRERNTILQCVRFVCSNDFLQK